MDPTPVSWHKVAKTGAFNGLRGLAPFIGYSSSILYSDFGLIRWPLLLLILGGVCSRWAVAAAMRYHQAGCVIGISTLALLSCAVSPTLSRLIRFWFCTIPMECPLTTPITGEITVLYRLWEYIMC